MTPFFTFSGRSQMTVGQLYQRGMILPIHRLSYWEWWEWFDITVYSFCMMVVLSWWQWHDCVFPPINHALVLDIFSYLQYSILGEYPTKKMPDKSRWATKWKAGMVFIHKNYQLDGFECSFVELGIRSGEARGVTVPSCFRQKNLIWLLSC